MYCIGIDGGGTKSRLMATDRKGGEYGPVIGGSTNIHSNSPATVQKNIRDLVQGFLRERGATDADIDALVIGSAGVDIPEHVTEMEALLRDGGFTCPLRVVNDVEILLESEVRGQPGIVLISGTGSVGLGKGADGRVHRVGGWGHVVGDEGSGYWIGREAIRRTLRAFDGRETPTLLTGLLGERFGLNSSDELLRVVYDPATNKSDIAALARLVDDAALGGDATATSILDSAAEELFLMAKTLVETCGLVGNFPIVVNGGILKSSEPVWQRLAPQLRQLSPNTIKATKEPCVGAVYMAEALAKQ